MEFDLVTDIIDIQKLKKNVNDQKNKPNYALLLGELLRNRMGGVTYYNLKKDNSLYSFPKYFRNTLLAVFEFNKKQTLLFKKKLCILSKLFENVQFKHAFLKGAFLTSVLYPEGLRTSNDIDIIINQSDISECQDILIKAGFIQGKYDPAKGILPASRRDILFSRMNYGETIGFLKEIEDNEYIDVDINFSLDFKANNERNLVGEMLDNTVDFSVNDCKLKTLDLYDFLIHLCCHLYKEATTYDWVIRNSDLLLYKFNDIQLFIKKYGNSEYLNQLWKRINFYNLKKECYYTFINVQKFYPSLKDIDSLNSFIDLFEFNDYSFLKQIHYPSKQKTFHYTISFEDWFLCKNKLEILQEI